MSRVYLCGAGAVSPAGWGMQAFREALSDGRPLPTQALPRPGWEKNLRIRQVPSLAARPEFLAHPRLRRASPLSQFATAAALEALQGVRAPVRERGRIGIVFAMQSGPVQYATRFYSELLQDPATASPVLFPETVFSAPASHIAALLGKVPIAYTVVGDPAAILDATAIAAAWLLEGRVEACLVVGAEEFNWLHADALWRFSHSAVLSAGAGALGLALEPGPVPVVLETITDAFSYHARQTQAQAACAMRAQLPAAVSGELLCDGLGGINRVARAENQAWKDWAEPRLSCKQVLGEGLMASSAWQCVAAWDAVANGKHPAARVGIVGCNQQAIGARFLRG